MTSDPPAVPGVTHRSVVVDGFRVHYAEAGEGDPLVMVHGWPQHWWCWRHLIGPLSERYRVICPDIRGLGWSEGPGASATRADYSFHRLAADFAGFLDALGIRRTRFVGHDWGCVLGYRAAINWPDRFERAVMLGGVHPWTPTGAPLRVYARPWHIYAIAALGPASTPTIAARCLNEWRHVGRFDDAEMETYVAQFRAPAAAAASVAYDRNLVLREIPYFVRHHRALRLRVPVLHLNGACDALTQKVPKSYVLYNDTMRLELIEDCGHFMAEERPEELLDRLTPFLGRA
jgi:pimeloyl-ACP methyl ester carboxylesterase